MPLASFIHRILQDTNPRTPEFEPSEIYIALCLLIPVFMGIITGLISSLIVRIASKKGRRRGEVSDSRS